MIQLSSYQNNMCNNFIKFIEDDHIDNEELMSDKILVKALTGYRNIVILGEDPDNEHLKIPVDSLTEAYIKRINSTQSTGYIRFVKNLPEDKQGKDFWVPSRVTICGSNSIYYLTLLTDYVSDNRQQAGFTSMVKDIYYPDTSSLAFLDCISYSLDIIAKNVCDITSYTMDSTDHMFVNPLRTVSKAVLMYNCIIGRVIVNQIREYINQNTDNEQIRRIEFLNSIDRVFNKYMCTDWMQLDTFKLNDKSNIFSPQLTLREDIYNLCMELNNLPMDQFYNKYKELFVYGDIYLYDKIHPAVVSYLYRGQEFVSTAYLNSIWNRYT